LRAGRNFRLELMCREENNQFEAAMDHTLERLRSEFLEMPGLRLTAEQVHRFCGVERADCAVALAALVRENFLCAWPDGTYARTADGLPTRHRQARVTLSAKRQAS
jgi:hypothetical protein